MTALASAEPPEQARASRPPPRWLAAARAAAAWCLRRWAYLGCAALALGIAGWYAARVLAWGPRLGFPLDDAYIYMTYAKQIARGRPFTYFDGGGFSAGATSMLWPAVLAPFWAIGFRGHWFCYAVFGVCAALLAATAALAFHLGRRTLGAVGGAVAALLIVCSGPLSWAYLSGMEVPLAGTLILACVAKLVHEGAGPRPSRGLLALLAATAIARPEAGLLVALVVGTRALAQAWRRRWTAAARWLSPLFAPVVVALTTRIFAGHFTPNTAVSKSHFYLPGFDWVYYQTALWKQTKGLLGELFWDAGKTPLFAARLLGALWLVGALRLVVWGVRERRLTAVAMLLGAPAAIFAAVIAASGQWKFQNYRYIAAALPALLTVVGLAVAPPRKLPGLALPRPVFVGLGALAGLFGLWAAHASLPVLRENLRLYAQGARDNNAQVVTIGRWIDAHLPPGAHVAIHDVGAIGYYSHRRLTDVIGLITNHQAEICNQGPGARFEAFERMTPAERPTHFAYYPGWLVTGSRDFFGRSLFRPPVPPPLGNGPRMLGGGSTPMEVFEARWDALGSGARPLELPAGWAVVDEVERGGRRQRARPRLSRRPGPAQLRRPHEQVVELLLDHAAGGRHAAPGRRRRPHHPRPAWRALHGARRSRAPGPPARALRRPRQPARLGDPAIAGSARGQRRRARARPAHAARSRGELQRGRARPACGRPRARSLGVVLEVVSHLPLLRPAALEKLRLTAMAVAL